MEGVADKLQVLEGALERVAGKPLRQEVMAAPVMSGLVCTLAEEGRRKEGRGRRKAWKEAEISWDTRFSGPPGCFGGRRLAHQTRSGGKRHGWRWLPAILSGHQRGDRGVACQKFWPRR
jgi:hypothetical protein